MLMLYVSFSFTNDNGISAEAEVMPLVAKLFWTAEASTFQDSIEKKKQTYFV
jgi:hypothetical protein